MYINDDDVKDKFTMVDNFVLHKCPYLSLKAKAILIYIKSKPKGWVVTQSEIIKNVKDSRQAVASGLRELEEHKHLYRDDMCSISPHSDP
jgi:hypothetical protein